MKLLKGNQGYIKRKKMRQILITIGLALIGVLIFVVGFILNKQNKANAFTVMAVLMVLPATQYLVSFIVLFPFQSVSKERYEVVNLLTTKQMCLLTDLVITSPEKIMNLDFIIIKGNNIIGLLGKKKQDAAKIQTYLAKSVSNYVDGYMVKIFIEEQQFIQEIESTPNIEVDQERQEKAVGIIKTLIV